MKRWAFCLGIFVLPCFGAASRAADAFSLKDGDRVVFLGNTLIEREQRHAYWETALVRRFPSKNIVFRNLGWSGDTVFGEARARFGSTEAGFTHLREHVLSLNPTVIVLGYGTNESFEGPAGLPRFLEGCKRLTTTLAPTNARLVWLSPLRQETMPPPLPEPTEQNKNLKLYRDALAEFATKNKQLFVDLFTLVGDASIRTGPLTDNGIHLTAQGYWRSALALEHGLGLTEPVWKGHLKSSGEIVAAEGTKIKMLPGNGMRWEVNDAILPYPSAPEKNARTQAGGDPVRLLRIEGLAPGKHTLTIDGQPAATASAEEWSRGVVPRRGPEFDQVEQLREAILAKNLLYFHRWRPQNETYLTGFRKHEQGRNASEIPEFDPLVAKKEEEIVKLSSPRPHTYEIKPGADR
jgi:lysophospholipase L1-like esterase